MITLLQMIQIIINKILHKIKSKKTKEHKEIILKIRIIKFPIMDRIDQLIIL